MEIETLSSILLLMGVAMAGGAVNAIAGGGTFFTFPALMLAGIPPVAANVTTTVALWPATITSALAYRHQRVASRAMKLGLVLCSLVGGTIGAGLLLALPERSFEAAIPWLLLIATVLFTFGNRLHARVGGAVCDLMGQPSVALCIGQLAIAVYGGYFGAGIGILMLAQFTLMGVQNIHHANALKAILGLAINGVAVAYFALMGPVVWSVGAPMIAGALLGGHVGAKLALRVDKTLVRNAVIVFAWLLTVGYFIKNFG